MVIEPFKEQQLGYSCGVKPMYSYSLMLTQMQSLPHPVQNKLWIMCGGATSVTRSKTRPLVSTSQTRCFVAFFFLPLLLLYPVIRTRLGYLMNMHCIFLFKLTPYISKYVGKNPNSRQIEAQQLVLFHHSRGNTIIWSIAQRIPVYLICAINEAMDLVYPPSLKTPTLTLSWLEDRPNQTNFF